MNVTREVSMTPDPFLWDPHRHTSTDTTRHNPNFPPFKEIPDQTKLHPEKGPNVREKRFRTIFIRIILLC